MKDKSISVIIPVYNCEKEIINCVESVLGQSRTALISEIIIVNDGSNDGTLKTLNKIKKVDGIDIRIINQSNKGVSCARNAGINMAKSEWIAFIDSDDSWHKNKLKIQEQYIDSYTNISIIGANVNEKDQIIGWNKKISAGFVEAKDMIVRSFPQTSSVIARTEAIKEFGGFDPKQSYCEDMNLFIKIAFKYKYFHINKQLVCYGNGKPQIGGEKGLSADIKKMNAGAKKNLKDFHEIGILNNREYIFYYLFNELKYMRRIMKKIGRKYNESWNYNVK